MYFKKEGSAKKEGPPSLKHWISNLPTWYATFAEKPPAFRHELLVDKKY
jgi:hypothetical protein